ncbi:TPA: hypothetical protein KRE09_002278 [Clostridioides difficile]|uniref:hypothetical protein n=1 Tax=Clostridioides difficile TaxID=1496 RepID=UPI0005B4FA89|nr:hypothetical protein [Clostridioides difficile]AUO78318.1 hypothetical protein LIBA6276_00100 [Clostridioides phage LIBA6276]AUO78489.1 hypothetical protein LIBA2945_00099 [Clostridioides phage LIBA2945]MDC0804365.1 hypothetical protein [Clostridium paraputrificum]MDB0488154.1 hypothetical protein [Clostridioides difficile]MDL0414239.1 hypothetical protein [Clostridioides difficile]
MDFERNVILKNGNLQVTLVNDIKTDSYSIGLRQIGGKPEFKYISRELYNKLLKELLNQEEVKFKGGTND